MKKQRTGFEYIDLDNPHITEKYRPHPASNPTEVYVARLRAKKVNDDIVINVVNAVYRLIPKRQSKSRYRERKSDGRILAVKVTRGELVNTFRRYYDQTFEEDLEE